MMQYAKRRIQNLSTLYENVSKKLFCIYPLFPFDSCDTDLDKVKELMLTPIAGETTEREPYNGYLIFQGGIPEVEEFIRKFHK